ncbi:hypothetical protein PASE110613_00110 [Paenibacillus sediminis]|uniref:Uncharacterized protein n=1 Tax=Paenibacillus sediminis TaxID=664909 RepID=A0ABS4H0E1_9BACL|nr:hypothetical protein [Paenibacillus sediminis]MBP1936017.1 hypothetical protein [Paenibacillus sediminis]
MRYFTSFLIIIPLIFLSGCNSSQGGSSGDWSSNFVVWQGNMYIFNDTTVEEVDEQIGKIEEYSDNEANKFSSNIFSNIYDVGTEIYKIKDTSTDEAIAVKIQDKYFKGINRGKYGS